MNKHDVLTEHYSVIVAADILRGETLKHLPGVHQNQVPLDTYIPLAREITLAILTECQRYHERMADQVLFIRDHKSSENNVLHEDYVDNQALTRTMELMKADLFHSMIKTINNTDNVNSTKENTDV